MRCLLHGFTQSPRSWDRVLELLAGPSLRPALLGHGAPVVLETFDAEVDRLASLLEEPVHLVGYSLGARLALGLLARHPSRVRSAVLIGCHPGLESDREREERVVSDERWARVAIDRGIEAFVSEWEKQPLLGGDPASVAAQREVRLAHSPAGLAAALRVLGLGRMPSRWSALSAAACPVAMVVGERDVKFRQIAESVRRRADVRVHVVEGAGHNVVMDAPAALAEIVRSVEAST